MTSVNSLVDIAVFGIVGAIMMAALVGLLLVASGRAGGVSPGVQRGFAAAALALLVAVPTLAAINVLASGAGFWRAFAVAACVAAIAAAVNIGLSPLVARRQGSAGTVLRPSLPVFAIGLVLCLALGLVTAGLAALFA
ncbi:hypothetical protein ACOQFV_21815 [Nocardiopsis changdeensis]|uniref:Major facilitator superfamily (MFS) profile domain-containing protein n=1 Tax=Nocardiopsis changdeensis TaxID=2831969 RepID=A0ABX8BHF7_9ACTN|nr:MULTISPECIES: hypothetical protein [Nocardiopsis]QUX21489.1 hypothetical protein KGD84_24225 [Nocardiopsis changdeensis]QYX37423.1 hypothetical protein K1J57_01595 [Nocardiopsis sp. MT53]